MSELKLAGIIRESIVDGPGIRLVVFAQGCPHHCPGCHNPQTWPFTGGSVTTPAQVVEQMKKNPLLKGLTLSGGEPFCQSAAMAELAAAARAEGFDVIAYTGFTLEQLLEKAAAEPEVLALLRQVDVLIDGPFLENCKSYNLRFRGSANQRLLDVPQSLRQGKAVLKSEYLGETG